MSATVSRATDALSAIATATPLFAIPRLSDNETVVAVMLAVSSAVTERLAPLTLAPFTTDAVTVLPIVFTTTLSAPATEMDVADNARLIDADVALAKIVADSVAPTSTAPVTTSRMVMSISCTVTNAGAAAIVTAVSRMSVPPVWMSTTVASVRSFPVYCSATSTIRLRSSAASTFAITAEAS